MLPSIDASSIRAISIAPPLTGLRRLPAAANAACARRRRCSRSRRDGQPRALCCGLRRLRLAAVRRADAGAVMAAATASPLAWRARAPSWRAKGGPAAPTPSLSAIIFCSRACRLDGVPSARPSCAAASTRARVVRRLRLWRRFIATAPSERGQPRAQFVPRALPPRASDGVRSTSRASRRDSTSPIPPTDSAARARVATKPIAIPRAPCRWSATAHPARPTSHRATAVLEPPHRCRRRRRARNRAAPATRFAGGHTERAPWTSSWGALGERGPRPAGGGEPRLWLHVVGRPAHVERAAICARAPRARRRDQRAGARARRARAAQLVFASMFEGESLHPPDSRASRRGAPAACLFSARRADFGARGRRRASSTRRAATSAPPSTAARRRRRTLTRWSCRSASTTRRSFARSATCCCTRTSASASKRCARRSAAGPPGRGRRSSPSASLERSTAPRDRRRLSRPTAASTCSTIGTASTTARTFART